jgi:hypothetical protein
MGIYYTAQPEDREPVEFTHFDCWEDDETWTEVLDAWEKTLGIKLPRESESDLIVALLQRGYDVYWGDSFIEIYEGVCDEEI